VALWERIAQGALAFTGIKAEMTGMISVQALGLTQRTLKSMALIKLKITGALMLAVSVAVGGGAVVAYRALAGEQRSVQEEQGPRQPTEEMNVAKADAEKPGRTDLYGDPLPLVLL
jgi:hypothetical protein